MPTGPRLPEVGRDLCKLGQESCAACRRDEELRASSARQAIRNSGRTLQRSYRQEQAQEASIPSALTLDAMPRDEGLRKTASIEALCHQMNPLVMLYS
jgi:hypothetical protein